MQTQPINTKTIWICMILFGLFAWNAPVLVGFIRRTSWLLSPPLLLWSSSSSSSPSKRTALWSEHIVSISDCYDYGLCSVDMVMQSAHTKTIPDWKCSGRQSEQWHTTKTSSESANLSLYWWLLNFVQRCSLLFSATCLSVLLFRPRHQGKRDSLASQSPFR